MEELRPEELEELVQELEEEDKTQEALPQDVEELLRVLQSGHSSLERRDAAEQLGNVETSSPRIVRTLIAACESEPYPKAHDAAVKSLRALVHQEVLQRHPDLRDAAERALQPHPRSPTGDGPSDEESGKSFRSGVFWNLSWAVVYLLAVVGTSILAWEQVGDWALWAAAAVWFGGGVLGLVILVRKGHLRAAAILDWVGSALTCRNWLGTLIMIPLLLALVGPVILPVALLIRPRDDVGRIAKRRARMKDTDHTRSAPVDDRDRPSDCNACGAWVAPGSEHCNECGAVQ